MQYPRFRAFLIDKAEILAIITTDSFFDSVCLKNMEYSVLFSFPRIDGSCFRMLKLKTA